MDQIPVAAVQGDDVDAGFLAARCGFTETLDDVLDVVAVELFGHLAADNQTRNRCRGNGNKSADRTLSRATTMVEFDSDERSMRVNSVDHLLDARNPFVDVDAHLPDASLAVGTHVARFGEDQCSTTFGAAGRGTRLYSSVMVAVDFAVVAFHRGRHESVFGGGRCPCREVRRTAQSRSSVLLVLREKVGVRLCSCACRLGEQLAQMATHAIRIGFDTRQECEGVRGLSHQHLATVEDSTSESNCSVE